MDDLVPDPLAALTNAVDALAALEPASMSSDGLLDLLRGIEVQTRRLAALDTRLVAETAARGLAVEHGCRNIADLLVALLRIDPREASSRVRAAADFAPRYELDGAAVPPRFRVVADAGAAGTIGPEHAGIVSGTIDALPAALAAESAERVEQWLTEQAELHCPRTLRRIARRLADTLDPDGTLSTDQDRARRRHLDVHQRADGSSRIRGELDAICTEALLTALDSTARPGPVDHSGQPDARTATQRRHDGLKDALLTLLRSARLPACGGVAATIVLTMDATQLPTRSGLATTGHGALISADQALTLVGDARVQPVALGPLRSIDSYGHTQRIFTEQQRLALIARDGGCSFPGCTVPPAWCQAHHITDFAITRRTRVDDGTLLCGYHHREHPRLGWTCQLINGAPHWIPPPHIDSGRKPRRNTAHSPALE